jgi:chloramphenicol-sensitive protein RarD
MFEREVRRGAAYAVAAFSFWGITPLYYKLLSSVGSAEILAHRIVWTVFFGVLLLSLTRRWPQLLHALRSTRMKATLLLSSLLVSTNWLVYIYAVQTERILDASLGYYINPLVNVLLGVTILGERMSPARALAVVLAAAGTLNLAVGTDGLPWIALTLGFSFGFYGLVRKRADVPALGALVVETGYVLPLALGALLWLASRGQGAFLSGDRPLDWLLLAAGPVTMLPLIWFTMAARRLPLNVVGLFQYIGPTLSLLLAVFLFDEPFTTTHAVTFFLIWAALGLSTVDTFTRARRQERLKLIDDAPDSAPPGG